MNCNKRYCNKMTKSALGDSVDVEIQKRDAIVADSVEVENGTIDAVVVLLSLAAPREGDVTSPLNNVVIDEGGGDAEVDGGRDNNNFEGDGNDLEQGKEETTLTDSAMDTGSNAGADRFGGQHG
jgi:hypothetical protein